MTTWDLSRGALRRLAGLFGLLLLNPAASAVCLSEGSGAGSARSVSELEAVESEAWERFRAWQEAGRGPLPSALRARIDRLWEMGSRAPQGSPVAAAKGEALHLLVHVADLEGLEERIDELSATDPVWERVVQLMVEVGSYYGEGALVERVLRPRTAVTADPEARARLWLTMGDAWGEEERAKAEDAYQRALDEAPGSWAARVAEGNLYELANLQVGAPAPRFSVTTVSGETLCSDDLAGHAVVLHVWASW